MKKVLSALLSVMLIVTSLTCLLGISVSAEVAAPEANYTHSIDKALGTKLDYTGGDVWATKVSFGETINLNSREYLELDVYSNSTGIRLWFYDGSNNRGYKDLSGFTANAWNHVVMSATDFDTGYGLNGNKSAAVGLMAENFNGEIHFANVAFTKFAPDANYTHYLAKAFNCKLNYKGSDAWATKTPFGETVNLNSYEYLELDVYSNYSSVRLYFYDGNNNRGFKDFSLTANAWNHLVMTPNTFDIGYGMNGNKSAAVGLMAERGTEIHIANVAFTKFAPDAKYTHYLGKEINFTLNYSGSDAWATRKGFGESVNFRNYDYLEMDVYAPASTLRFYFIDSTNTHGSNSGRGFHDISGLTANAWNHVVFSSTSFDTGYGMNGNLADVVGFMEDVNGELHIANVALTKFAPNPEYTHYLGKELNYTLNYTGADAWATRKSIGETVDVTKYDYLEMDVYCPYSTMRFYFCDSTCAGGNEGRGMYDFSGITPNTWCHLIMPTSSFDTGWGMNGNKTDVTGFMVSVDGEYHIANVALTNFTPDAAYTYDVIKAFGNCKLDYKGGDAWATKKYFGETVNLNAYDYIEMDVYASSSNLRFFFLDSTNKNGNEGRGFHDCPITANKWTHVVFPATNFDTGWGMNGNKADVVAFIADGFGSEVHIANFAFTGYNLAIDTASLTLSDDLAINYKADKSIADNFTNLALNVSMNGEDKVIDSYVVDGDYIVFTFDGINPDQMNDNISAYISGVRGGVTRTSEVKDYSVATYCYNMLGKTEDDTLKTLLVDTLNYGAASQIYNNYNVDALANADLTPEQAEYASAAPVVESILNTEYAVIDDAAASFVGAGLSLSNTVQVKFVLKAASLENLVVKAVVEGETTEITPDSFVHYYGEYYYVYFDGITASQLSDAILVTAYNGDTAISNTVQYSVESYVAEMAEFEDANFTSLIDALMKYGVSAAAYNA